MRTVLLLLYAAMVTAVSFEVAAAQSKRVVAYFPEWGVKHQPYYVKDIETHGAADKITVLMYAFSEPSPDSSGQIEPKFMDPYEAYQRVYTWGMSVDGVADDSAQALRGQFNQLKKLKKCHPGLRILISIGGWTGSGYFSDAVATPASRQEFADAIIQRFILGNLPKVNGAGGGGAAAGVFDGVDIDWEYPISGGNTGNHHNPTDAENLTAFYALLRAKLDAINPKLLLTAAVPAGETTLRNYQIVKDQKYLDWYNLMTYDFTGAWDPRTGHHANLLSSPESPTRNSFDRAVHFMLDTLGVEPGKIVPGVAFYGRGWQDVAATDGGLRQAAGGGASGEFGVGINNYSQLSLLTHQGYEYHWDPAAMAPWLYDRDLKIFWSLDDAKSIALKFHYVLAYNLGGIMCWDITGDDSSGTLIDAMSSGRMPGMPEVKGQADTGTGSCTITAPAAGSEFMEGSNVIFATMSVVANGSIAATEFFVDGKSIGYDTKAPFDWVWFNVPAGEHALKAVAVDGNGNTFSSGDVRVIVATKH